MIFFDSLLENFCKFRVNLICLLIGLESFSLARRSGRCRIEFVRKWVLSLSSIGEAKSMVNRRYSASRPGVLEINFTRFLSMGDYKIR